MGGIAGIIRFDGLEIDPRTIGEIIGILKHRGNFTPQPIKNGILMAFGASTECTIEAPLLAVADADVFSSEFPDQTFCRNYMQNGVASFNEPNADFAVALWDASRQTLYCARDIMGVKPLYYVHQPNRFFAFASEIKALKALNEVPIKPNGHKFREYLTWKTVHQPYNSETFYEGIYSVLPGHYLEVTPEKAEHVPYWKPNFSKYHNLEGIEAYASVFRDVFTGAIDNRIKSKKSIGAHLSGGLDSSSISCVSQFLLNQHDRPALFTFNIDTEQRLAEEQKYALDVTSQWNTKHFKLNPLPDVLDSILKVNQIFDRPEHFIIPSSFHLSVSAKAKTLGCDIILNGHGGDNVATTGFSLLNDLMSTGKWDSLQLASEQYFQYNKQHLIQRYPGKRSMTDKKIYEKYVLSFLTDDLKSRYKRESLTTLLSGFLQQKKRFGLSKVAITSYIFEKLLNRLTGFSTIDDILSRDFNQIHPREQQTTEGLVNSILAESQISPDGILDHVNVICNEQLNHIGAYFGHQYSFPFFDKNVIELCLSTPIPLSFDNGRGRGLIRHGMRDLLPASILERHTKANFVEYGTLAAQQLYNATRETISSTSHPIWDIVDRKQFLKVVSIVFNSRIPGNLKTRYNWQLSRAIYLSIWLDSIGK